MLKKNTANQFIYFVLIKLADGTPFTGETPDGYVAKDGAAQAGIGGSISENANGQYEVALSQGDTNGDEIGYLFTNAGAVPISLTVTTETKKMADLNDFAAGDAVNLSANAIKAVSYDESTAWPLLAADTGATQVARVGADGDTLEVLSDEIAALPDAAAINAEVDTALTDIHLDHLVAVDFDADSPVGHATSLLRQLMEVDSSLIRFTTEALANAPGALGDATATKQDEILADLVDIKGTSFVKDTHSLYDIQVELAVVDVEIATIDGIVDAILVDTGTTLDGIVDAILVDTDATIPAILSTIDSIVDSILVDTGTTIPATIATIDGEISTIDGIVDNILTDTGTTLDTIVDSILTDTGTTLPATLATIDGICDDIKALLRGDHVVDSAETPYEYLILAEGTADVLLTKEMFETDDTNITAVTQVVGKMLQP